MFGKSQIVMEKVEELDKSLSKSIDDLAVKAKKLAQEVKELRDFKQEVEAHFKLNRSYDFYKEGRRAAKANIILIEAISNIIEKYSNE
jgi:hypothetical protein